MATGEKNYDIAKETTSQEILTYVKSNGATKITNATLNTQNQIFSGEGQGVLYIQTYAPLDSEYKVTITIDGKTLGSLIGATSTGFIQIPFSQSFTVKRGSETGSSYPTYCNAIFY